jgi:hypothetical protein
MFTVTQEAGAHLARLLDEVSPQRDLAVRFVAVQHGLSMRLDNVRPGDRTFDTQGRTVLLIDEKVGRTLDDHCLELEPSPHGPQLLIR